jgi:hypothetical protein
MLDGAVVNLAGRQRMASQQMTKEADLNTKFLAVSD